MDFDELVKNIILRLYGFPHKQIELVVTCNTCQFNIQSPYLDSELPKIDHSIETGHTDFNQELITTYYLTIRLKHLGLLVIFNYLLLFLAGILLAILLSIAIFFTSVEYISNVFSSDILVIPVIFGFFALPAMGSNLYRKIFYNNFGKIKIYSLSRGEHYFIYYVSSIVIIIPILFLFQNTSGIIQYIFALVILILLLISSYGFYGGIFYLMKITLIKLRILR